MPGRRAVGGALAGGIALGSLWARGKLHPPPYRGPLSDHWDGKRFHAPKAWSGGAEPEAGDHDFGDFLRWALGRDPGPWRSWTPLPSHPPPPRRVAGSALRVTFVNHATLLIQIEGLNLLTDPIWSERTSPVDWLGPRRHHAPGIAWEDLPPVDVVLVTHNHYDHLDIPTLQRLAREHAPRIFVPLGNRALLERRGIAGVTEMDWWDEIPLAEGVQLQALPAKHWSNRAGVARNTALWAAWAIRGSDGTVFFAGDSGYGPHFREIRERCGPIRLALLPIGAYEPRWFMQPSHMSPADAVRAHQDLDAAVSIATHWGCFQLTDEGQDAPLAELGRVLAAADGARPEFWTLQPGEGREVPRTV